MDLIEHRDHPAPAMLAGVIAHSQIVVAAATAPLGRFPAGFDEVDIAILDWIAAAGRRLGGDFARM